MCVGFALRRAPGFSTGVRGVCCTCMGTYTVYTSLLVPYARSAEAGICKVVRAGSEMMEKSRLARIFLVTRNYNNAQELEVLCFLTKLQPTSYKEANTGIAWPLSC